MAAQLAPLIKSRPRSGEGFEFHRRLTQRQIVELWQLYQSEWWSRGRKIDDVRRAVEHSSLIFSFCEPENGPLVAFARVLTDYVYKALVFDVIVERSHRGHGLGRRLLEAIVSHPAMLFVEHIELYCRPEMVGFYERFGFAGGRRLRFLRRTQVVS